MMFLPLIFLAGISWCLQVHLSSGISIVWQGDGIDLCDYLLFVLIVLLVLFQHWLVICSPRGSNRWPSDYWVVTALHTEPVYCVRKHHENIISFMTGKNKPNQNSEEMQVLNKQSKKKKHQNLNTCWYSYWYQFKWHLTLFLTPWWIPRRPSEALSQCLNHSPYCCWKQGLYLDGNDRMLFSYMSSGIPIKYRNLCRTSY